MTTTSTPPAEPDSSTGSPCPAWCDGPHLIERGADLATHSRTVELAGGGHVRLFRTFGHEAVLLQVQTAAVELSESGTHVKALLDAISALEELYDASISA